MNDTGIEIRTYFARHRNALVARGEFSELFAAWYLHRMDSGLTLSPACDILGRDMLAAVTLHAAGRPWKESCAWTVHFGDPLANVFAAVSNPEGTVVVNVLTDNVKPDAAGVFYSDVVSDGKTPRRSVVDFEGGAVLPAVETFYDRSEQRACRIFALAEEDLVMISAQPDCDLEWLASLDTEAARRLDQDVELALLEKRSYRFFCGCNQQRMLDFLAPIFRRQGDALFDGDPVIRIHCPRCGARHGITREALEARTAEG